MINKEKMVARDRIDARNEVVPTRGFSVVKSSRKSILINGLIA
jgi:hypothetical protein